MNKSLLIALPILALFAIGTIALVHHKEASSLKASPVDTVTFDSLRACQGNIKSRQCNEIEDDKQFSICSQSAYDFGHLTQAGNILLACDKYNTLFQTASSLDLINKDNNYVACYTDLQVLNAVKKSDFYYRNIFAPKYIDCAKLNM